MTSFSSEQPLPPLKTGLEAIQIQHEGNPMVLLRDQEGIVRQSMAVTLPGFIIAASLNGKNTMADVQRIFSENTGVMIKTEEITSMLAQLEKGDMLETEGLKKKRKQVLDDFIKSPVRKPFHIGGGYPEDNLELAAFLGKFFQAAKGPGKQLSSNPVGAAPQGLFAPHIDFYRGGPAYAWAYQNLSETTPPDVVVAFGVAHVSPNSPWVFADKTFETPYGPLGVNADVYQELESCLWYNPEVDLWTHRTEHSLEFQALWLKYLWREKTPSWVPILTSSFLPFCPDKPPSTVKSLEEGIQKMGEKLKARQAAGQKILILAGVDMAHVGPRFGDNVPMGPETDKKVASEDSASIEHALKLDADAMYMSVVADNEWRKWCGLSAMYTAIRLIKILSDGKATGEFLSYGQAPDPLGGLVSFASVVFPRKSA